MPARRPAKTGLGTTATQTMATTVIVQNPPEVSKFYGDPTEVDNFVREIKDFWGCQPSLTDEQKFSTILRFVSSNVRNEIELCDTHAKVPDQVLVHLQQVYGDSRPARLLMAAFLQMEQRSGEGARDFSSRLAGAFRHLNKRLKSDGRQETPESTLKEQFLASVSSEALRHQLGEMLHAKAAISFNELREAAIRWESRCPGVPATAAAVTAAALAPTHEAIDKLSEQVASLAAIVKQQATSSNPAKPRGPPRPSKQPPPPNPRHHTHQGPSFHYPAPPPQPVQYPPVYHTPMVRQPAPLMASRAPNPHQAPPSQPGNHQRFQRSGLRCFACSQVGHRAVNCPYNTAATGRNGNAENCSPRSL